MAHRCFTARSCPAAAGPTCNTRLRFAVTALLLAVGLTGCGSDGGSSDQPAGSAATGSSNWDRMKWDQDKWD